MPALIPPPIDAHIRSLLQLAVAEDLGAGDKTVELSIPETQSTSARIVARKPGMLAGSFLIAPILELYDPRLRASALVADGSRLFRGQPVAVITGPTRAVLSAERVLLNFLSHLSGIATLTRRYVDVLAGLRNPPVITDTRKTMPGYRALDKYAVRCGGGVNHRMALYDGVMLKDNHLAALRKKLGGSRSLAQLTSHIRKELDPKIPLWLEVDTLEQLRNALPGGADIILLDNFTPGELAQAVEIRDAVQSKIENRKSKILLEASGGITLGNLREVAETGIERIAIGALTHSAPILDLSMELA